MNVPDKLNRRTTNVGWRTTNVSALTGYSDPQSFLSSWILPVLHAAWWSGKQWTMIVTDRGPDTAVSRQCGDVICMPDNTGFIVTAAIQDLLLLQVGVINDVSPRSGEENLYMVETIDADVIKWVQTHAYEYKRTNASTNAWMRVQTHECEYKRTNASTNAWMRVQTHVTVMFASWNCISTCCCDWTKSNLLILQYY